MINVHDNLILSYTTDFKKKSIVMKTEYWDGDYHESTTLTFNNVIAHNFNQIGENLSIIFDIEEYDIEDFLEDEVNLLNKYKHYSWPFFYKNKEDLQSTLKARNIKYFKINATYGLDGFILATNVEVQTMKNL